MNTIEYEDFKNRLNALLPKANELEKALDIASLMRTSEELAHKTAEPDFWNDMENAQEIMKKSQRVKDKLDQFAELKEMLDDTQTLLELASEEEDDSSVSVEIKDNLTCMEQKIEAMTLTTLLTGEYDDKNAIITLHAGAGGTEAMDWVQMLLRMYTRWAESHGFSVKTLDFVEGDEAGIKSISLLIEGVNVYGYLKSETGVHRLVRVSPFDSSGRRHTSFASLEVIPEIDDSVEVDIKDDDLRIDTYRSSGAGGQHVNKTSSAVRITHLPTGIVTACQNERSQLQNKAVAMKMLRSKLIEIKEREHLEKIEDIKGEQKEIAWGSQIRSYVFMPYTLAKDHRTGFENGNINAVMDGDLDGFIHAYLVAKSQGSI